MQMDTNTVRTLTREFVGSWRADLWPLVTARVRRALVDSLVMEHVQMAYAAENEGPFYPAALFAFRDEIIAALATGIPRGSAGRIRFLIDF